MIINPYAFGSSAPTSPMFVGIDLTTDLTAASIPLNVPGATVDGDTLVCILRCRADRSITIPGGWTTHMAREITTGMTGSGYTRVYIISKARAGETSLSFTQSVNAACGGVLMVFRNGAVGNNAGTDGLSSSITKANANSLLVAVGLNNDGGSNTVFAPGNPAFTGYTQRGYSKWSGGAGHFYAAVAETRSFLGVGSVTATMTWTGPTDQQAVWLAEIG